MSISTSTSLPNLHAIFPCRSSGNASLSSLPRLSTSNLRYQCVANSGVNNGGPDKKIEPNEEKSSNQPPIQPAAPSPPLPDAPNWLKWTLGSIVWLAIPSWKSIRSTQDVVSKVETTAEVVEIVADATEKITSEVAEELPDGSRMKKAVVRLEHASKEVSKDAKVIESLVQKVELVEEAIKMGGKKVDEGKLADEKAAK